MYINVRTQVYTGFLFFRSLNNQSIIVMPFTAAEKMRQYRKKLKENEEVYQKTK